MRQVLLPCHRPCCGALPCWGSPCCWRWGARRSSSCPSSGCRASSWGWPCPSPWGSLGGAVGIAAARPGAPQGLRRRRPEQAERDPALVWRGARRGRRRCSTVAVLVPPFLAATLYRLGWARGVIRSPWWASTPCSRCPRRRWPRRWACSAASPPGGRGRAVLLYIGAAAPRRASSPRGPSSPGPRSTPSTTSWLPAGSPVRRGARRSPPRSRGSGWRRCCSPSPRCAAHAARLDVRDGPPAPPPRHAHRGARAARAHARAPGAARGACARTWACG